MIHGVDGREDDRLPFTHVPGSGPAGGGEFWYLDVPSARMLGAPGQKLQLAVLTLGIGRMLVGLRCRSSRRRLAGLVWLGLMLLSGSWSGRFLVHDGVLLY